MPPVGFAEITIPTQLEFPNVSSDSAVVEIETQPGVVKYQVFHNLENPEIGELMKMVAWLDGQTLENNLCNIYQGEEPIEGSLNNNPQYFIFRDLDQSQSVGRVGILSLDADFDDVKGIMDKVFGISEKLLNLNPQKSHEIANLLSAILLHGYAHKDEPDLIYLMHEQFVGLAESITQASEITISDAINNLKLFFQIKKPLRILEGRVINEMVLPKSRIPSNQKKNILDPNVLLALKELAINAKKYGGDNEVLLNIANEDEIANFSFYDKGIGIMRQDLEFQEDVLPRILQQQIRGENTGEIPGTGMGLSYIVENLRDGQEVLTIGSSDSQGAFGINVRREGEQIIIQALNPEELDFPEGYITKFALSFPLESERDTQAHIPEP